MDEMMDSEFIKELNSMDVTTIPLPLIAFIKRGVVLAQNNMWAAGGTDMTRWDVCTGCHRADWQGHADGCEVEKYINDANAFLKKLDTVFK